MIFFLEQREQNESQSDYSTTITERTTRSNTTNPSDSDKKPRKQQHVSIGPTTVAEKLATIETYFNQDELPPPPLPRQNHSPILSTTSSDTEIVANITNETPSSTPTPSPTLNPTRLQSVSEHDTLQIKSNSDSFTRRTMDSDRPPARLEKRNLSISTSPERFNPNKDEEEDEAKQIFTFFQ